MKYLNGKNIYLDHLYIYKYIKTSKGIETAILSLSNIHTHTHTHTHICSEVLKISKIDEISLSI